MKMRMFSMLLALCLLLSTGVLAASPEAVTGSAQALETGMELTLVLHTATTNGKIAVSYPAELELLETQTGFGDEVLWDVDPAKPGELSLAWISAKDVPAETTALTLTLAGEPGRYTFQVTPQELQRSGTKIDCPAFSVTGQIVHDRPCPSAAFQDLSQTAWYHAGVDYVLEPEVDDGYERYPVLPRGHHEPGHDGHRALPHGGGTGCLRTGLPLPGREAGCLVHRWGLLGCREPDCPWRVGGLL